MMILKYPVYDNGYMPCAAYGNRLIAAEERKTGRYPTASREKVLRRRAQTAVCSAVARYIRERLEAALTDDSIMEMARLTVNDLTIVAKWAAPAMELEITMPDDTLLTNSGVDALRSHLWATLHEITMYDATYKPFRDWCAALANNLPIA